MKPVVSAWCFALFLFIGMILMVEIGRRIGLRRRSRGSEDDKGGITTVEGAVFALFGLIIAFTFSGAATRFNEKRMLIVEEANTIEVAYLRLQLLPEKSRAALQGRFRTYTDSRIETYRRLPNLAAAEQEMGHSKQLREEIWDSAVIATREPDAHPDAGRLLLPAINNMIDMATTRTMALHIHPPAIIYALLFVLGVLCSLLAGYRMSASKERSWLHILAFATITVSVVYVVLDIEYPRAGLIRLESADQFLVDVRQSMH